MMISGAHGCASYLAPPLYAAEPKLGCGNLAEAPCSAVRTGFDYAAALRAIGKRASYAFASSVELAYAPIKSWLGMMNVPWPVGTIWN